MLLIRASFVNSSSSTLAVVTFWHRPQPPESQILRMCPDSVESQKSVESRYSYSSADSASFVMIPAVVHAYAWSRRRWSVWGCATAMVEMLQGVISAAERAVMTPIVVVRSDKVKRWWAVHIARQNLRLYSGVLHGKLGRSMRQSF